ncbi:MAG: FAD-binding oxidoreductase, partial [Lachnospiraceae bacterium]|nr:FAD-binding oxidoreductase [Lachnospiraceae bacterium]
MKKFVEAYSDRYEEYLRDESRYTGSCEEISFPDTVEAMAETARECLKQGRSVTVQGARTGLCGAGVPAGGHLLSTEKLERLVSVTEQDGRTL